MMHSTSQPLTLDWVRDTLVLQDGLMSTEDRLEETYGAAVEVIIDYLARQWLPPDVKAAFDYLQTCSEPKAN